MPRPSLTRSRALATSVGVVLLGACAPAGALAAQGRTVRLGDGLVGRAPHAGRLLTCSRPVRGSSIPAPPWVSTARHVYFPARRPVVDGTVAWPRARAVFKAGRDFSFTGNGLPHHARTGVFPVRSNDDAYPWVPRSRVDEQYVTARLSRAPHNHRHAGCVGTGPIGIATDGVLILPPLDRAGRDLVAREVRDRCDGRPDGPGLYTYRGGAPCLSRGESPRRASRLIGYARDGFPIYGPRGPHGRVLHNSDLDSCHGRTDLIRFHGRLRRMYHYSVTGEFPYVIGCFRGRAAGRWTAYPREPLALATQPLLVPAFSSGITDYVARCTGAPLALSVHAGAGAVSVDARAARRGHFTTRVRLAAGQATTVTSRAGGRKRTYHVRCLPPDFPTWTFNRLSAPSQEFYIVTPSPYVAIFDAHGVPVWWQHAIAALAQDAKLFGPDTIGWAASANPFSAPPSYQIHRLDGSVATSVSVRPTPPDYVQTPTDAHDIQRMANGDYMVISYKQRAGTVDLRPCGGPNGATVVDAELQEVRAGVDAPIWTWNSKDHLDVTDSSNWCAHANASLGGGNTYDLVHMNSLQVVGNSVIVSMRHTDAIYKIDYATKQITWKLGGTTTPQSLSLVGDPYGATSFGGQHYARQLPDGTITLHDNGTGRGRPPRAVRYRIDETARTATLLDQVVDPTVASSICCGSAEMLADGGWLMSWGGSPVVTEFAPGGARRFTLTFGNNLFSYRVSPVPAGRLSVQALRTGMDVMHPR